MHFVIATRDKQIVISNFFLEKSFKIDLEKNYKELNPNSTKFENSSDISSLDVYLCGSNKILFLIGTKGGFLFEITINYESEDDEFLMKLESIELLSKNHQSQSLKNISDNFKNKKQLSISVFPL
jgi:hypothetical protein